MQTPPAPATGRSHLHRAALATGPALVLLVVGVLAVGAIARTVRNTERVANAHVVARTVEEVVVLLLDGETAARGYVLTGDARFLAPYRGAPLAVARGMDSLRALVGKGGDAARIDEIAPLVRAKAEVTERVIRRARAGDRAGADSLIRDGTGENAMDRVRAAARSFRVAQERVTAERDAALRADAWWLGGAVGVGTLAAAVLALLTHWVLVRYGRAQATLVRALEERNEQLQDQAAEVEMQAEELQSQTAHLQETMAELHEGRALLHAVLDQMPAGVSIAEAGTGRLRFHNAASERLLGHPVADGADPGDYAAYAGFHPDGRRYTHDDYPLARVLRTGEPVHDEEMRYRRPGGEPAHFLVSAAPVRGPDGRLLAGVCTFHDISDRKRLEAELRAARAEAEEANRVKTEFLAAMSHELRTPLNAIAGYVELVELGVYGPVTDAQRHALERVRRNQAHLLGLISDILSYARTEVGHTEFDIVPVAVAELLAGQEAMLEPQLREREIAYTSFPCDAALQVWADRERADQVLLNLLVNAVKFTPRGGRVELSCDADDEEVRIRVRDTGRGIPAEMVQKIFDPFVQLDRRGVEASIQGVGLGLAISRELAERMGGSLSVQTMLGQGSVFTLSLPRVGREDDGPERRQVEDRRGGVDRREDGATTDAEGAHA